MAKGDTLSAKQLAFVAAYIGRAKGNATLAARIAGYSGTDMALGQAGHELLKNPKIKREIDRANAKVASAAIATTSEIQRMLTRIARDDPEESEHELEFSVQSGQAMIDPRKLTPEILQHMAEGGMPPPGSDVWFRRRAPKAVRLQAMNTLLKMRGALIDNLNVRVEGGLKALLPRLQRHMDPTAFEALIGAMAKVSEELAGDDA